MVTVLVIVGLVRFLDAIQPFGNIWLPYLELGVVFSMGGYLVFRRRRRIEL
jgi:LPXTG-motif cell wall-anchored protein